MKTLMRYLKKLAVESVTIFSYFISEKKRKKIPAFFVYLILSTIMMYLAVLDLFLVIWNWIFENADD